MNHYYCITCLHSAGSRWKLYGRDNTREPSTLFVFNSRACEHYIVLSYYSFTIEFDWYDSRKYRAIRVVSFENVFTIYLSYNDCFGADC